jgi:hypothetical protein
MLAKLQHLVVTPLPNLAQKGHAWIGSHRSQDIPDEKLLRRKQSADAPPSASS